MRTIKQRLVALGAFIVVVSGISLALAYSSNQSVRAVDDEQRFKLDRVLLASSTNDALMGLRLNAMDALVDRDSGTIDPELSSEMDANTTRLLENVKALTDKADDEPERKLLGTISDDIAQLLSAIDGMRKAIYNRLPEHEFSQFDDVIDTIGNRITANVTELRERLRAEYDSSSDDMGAVLAKSMNENLMVLGSSSTLFVLFIGMFGRGLLRPMHDLGDAMSQLAKNNLGVEVPALQRKDELGAMAQHVQFFKRSLLDQEAMREEQEQSKHMAEIEKKKAMHSLADGFEKAVAGIVSTVASSATQMKSFAQSLSKTAEQANHRATSVAAASEEAAANVSTVAAATEELSASIGEISRQVADSSATAGNAVTEARNTNQTVASMADAANKIGEVVQLISEIANQTNLLALNATIEAARAGEAGKGFAVVASEVKNLAAQTAKATEDITTQISAMQSVAGEAVKAIQLIGGTIEKINSISTAIAAAVEEQGAATSEISRNVQEAAAGTKDVSENIGGVTAAAGETGQVADQVLSAASALEMEAGRLKTEVSRFIETVRAA